jgi:uncharacterized repeat protein (TIGR01451 family)
LLTRQASTRVVVPPPPPWPDLSPSGKGAPRNGTPGGVLTYTLQLINEGQVTAEAVLTDTLPPSVTVVTASLPAGMACAGGVCTWSGTVPAFEMVELPYRVLVDGGVPTGTVLVNTMVVADGAGTVLTRTAGTVIWIGPWPDFQVYLPLVESADTLRRSFARCQAETFLTPFPNCATLPPGGRLVIAVPDLQPPLAQWTGWFE